MALFLRHTDTYTYTYAQILRRHFAPEVAKMARIFDDVITRKSTELSVGDALMTTYSTMSAAQVYILCVCVCLCVSVCFMCACVLCVCVCVLCVCVFYV